MSIDFNLQNNTASKLLNSLLPPKEKAAINAGGLQKLSAGRRDK